MIRAPSGISSPAGRPGSRRRPSARGSSARARRPCRATGRRRDALADDRVTADELPLGVVERAGLVQDRVRDGDLADVVQLGGVADCVDAPRSSGRAAARSRRRAAATPSRCAASSGSRSRSGAAGARPWIWRVGRARGPACFWAYIRWSAIRSASVGVRRLRGERRSSRTSSRSRSPRRARRAPPRRRAMIGSATPRRAQEDAELVAAHAEGACHGRRGSATRLRAEPREQRVARRVAERVVVVLEAVEVEEDEHQRALVAAVGERLVERRGERAAVAEAGQRVGQRLAAGGARASARYSRKVSTRRPMTANSARGASDDGERVQPAEAPKTSSPRPMSAEAERDHDEAQRLARPRRRGPARGCQAASAERAAGRPTSRCRTSRAVVGAHGGLDEVERVSEPEGDDPGREQPPGAVQAPADGRPASRRWRRASPCRSADTRARRATPSGSPETACRAVWKHQRRAHRADGERRGGAVGPERLRDGGERARSSSSTPSQGEERVEQEARVCEWRESAGTPRRRGRGCSSGCRAPTPRPRCRSAARRRVHARSRDSAAAMQSSPATTSMTLWA